MKIHECFATLERIYGSQSAAADAIPYNRCHYGELRNGKYPISPKAEKLIRAAAAHALCERDGSANYDGSRPPEVGSITGPAETQIEEGGQ